MKRRRKKFIRSGGSHPKKKLKGLFKGLEISEEEIEEAKKSLFPERELRGR